MFNQRDIKWLAVIWESQLSDIAYPSRKLAFNTLCRLVETFMRGQGKRMGSIKGVDRWSGEHLLLITKIIAFIADRDSPKAYYPTLFGLGLYTVEGFDEFFRECADKRESAVYE